MGMLIFSAGKGKLVRVYRNIDGGKFRVIRKENLIEPGKILELVMEVNF